MKFIMLHQQFGGAETLVELEKVKDIVAEDKGCLIYYYPAGTDEQSTYCAVSESMAEIVEKLTIIGVYLDIEKIIADQMVDSACVAEFGEKCRVEDRWGRTL